MIQIFEEKETETNPYNAQPWEIWQGFFPFDENNQEKKNRTLLILRNRRDKQNCLAFKITHVDPKDKHYRNIHFEIPIAPTELNGLTENSYIQILKKAEIPYMDLKYKRGVLDKDYIQILKNEDTIKSIIKQEQTKNK